MTRDTATGRHGDAATRPEGRVRTPQSALRIWSTALTVALGALAAPPPANAQQPTKIPRIGFLATGSPSSAGLYIEAFRQGLRELAYVEGQNISIEYRWGEGGFDQFLDFASDLVRGKVALILAWGATAAAAAQRTNNTPVVFVAVADPVGAGLVASLAQPGGNVTGLSNISADLMAKQVDLLKEVIPKATRLAVLRNPANPASALQARETGVAARSLRIQLQVVEVRAPNEFQSAFAAMTRARAGGFLVLPDPMFATHRTRIAELAAKHRLRQCSI